MSGAARALLQWSLGVAIVAIVLARFDLASVAARLSGVDPWLAALGVTGLVAAHLLGAAAWRRLLWRIADVRIGWRTAVPAYYAAQAVGAVTPGNVGADVYRVAAVDVDLSRRAAAVPIVIQRVASTLALFALGCAGLVVLPSAVAPDVLPPAPILAALVAAAAAMLLGTGPIMRRLGRRLDPQRDFGERGGWGPAVREAVGFGLVFHGLSLLLGLVLIAAIDRATVWAPGSALAALAALAVSRLSLAVPISPSGLGVQEAALAVLFGAMGLDPAVALAALLLNRVALVAVVLAGALAIGTKRRETEPPRGRLEVRPRGGRASAR